MSKICTTIEQCKKLLDLGIDINTADLTDTNLPLQDGSRFDFIRCKLPNETFPSITDGKSEKIPAWSLAALLNIIKNKCDYFELVYISNTLEGKANELKRGYRLSTDIYDVYENNPIDACYEMIIKLNEQTL